MGTHTFQVQELLRSMGFESEIFAGDIDADLARRAHPYREFARHRGRGEVWILYQSSIGSPMADYVMELHEPTILNFHNITPPELLEGWEPAVVDEVTVGRLQLTRMAGLVKAAIAVSCYNETELKQVGYATTAVAPLLVDLESMDHGVDGSALERLTQVKADGGADFLFVGRIAPHKAQHDLIKALAVYRRLYDANARLHLVGGVTSRSYRRALDQFVGELGLEEAVDFGGSVTPGQLGAYYRSASALVCASEHEGFCIPLLEAMYNALPIVAYGAAAVPETAEGVGLVLSDKSPTVFATAMHRAVSDPALRLAMVQAGRSRLEEYRLERARSRFADVMKSVVGRQSSSGG